MFCLCNQQLKAVWKFCLSVNDVPFAGTHIGADKVLKLNTTLLTNSKSPLLVLIAGYASTVTSVHPHLPLNSNTKFLTITFNPFCLYATDLSPFP